MHTYSMTAVDFRKKQLIKAKLLCIVVFITLGRSLCLFFGSAVLYYAFAVHLPEVLFHLNNEKGQSLWGVVGFIAFLPMFLIGIRLTLSGLGFVLYGEPGFKKSQSVLLLLRLIFRNNQ